MRYTMPVCNEHSKAGSNGKQSQPNHFLPSFLMHSPRFLNSTWEGSAAGVFRARIR